MMVGARLFGGGRCNFTVWAPHRRAVELKLVAPQERLVKMEDAGDGYWTLTLQDVQAKIRYFYRLDESIERADPASNFQPEGVHGPSEVVDHASFGWTDNGWSGVALEDMVVYELHVGTFTSDGTFASVIGRLKDLKELGVNAVEIMPVAQFPGDRNWGYDGAYPYAVQNSYGGPDGLKELVNACHRGDMAVILDVVYNHLGPEGNYLGDFGPYFTDKYKTPWGQAINFDGAYSDQVRSFFIENALYWLGDYHIDALRLDALHAIVDMSAKHFIEELTERVEQFSKQSGRSHYLIGESDLNDIRLIKPRRSGGYGLDAQWSDDFHHSLHALLTHEDNGYYRDFGSIRDLAKAFREGFVYTWQYSKHRKRHHGASSKGRPAKQFVVCIQNHDQVGNRMLAERLSALVDFEALKLAAGAVILSPYVPLLFMGEEYGEDSPFRYFVSHSDEKLIRAVRQGRRKEFESFAWQSAKGGPDPQALSTFEVSKLKWERRTTGRHAVLLDFYRRLIYLRRGFPAPADKTVIRVRCIPKKDILLWRRRFVDREIQCVMNFSRQRQQLKLYSPRTTWAKILDSAEAKWLGPGSSVPASVLGKESVSVPSTSIVLFERPMEQAEGQSRRAAAHMQLPRKEDHAHALGHV